MSHSIPPSPTELVDKTPDDKKYVDRIVEQAKQHMDANKGMYKGTNIHYITELLDYGESTVGVDEEDLADARAYRSPLEPSTSGNMCRGMFRVANIHVRCCGNIRRLILPDIGYVVTDIKTGNSPDLNMLHGGRLHGSCKLCHLAATQPWSNGFPPMGRLGFAHRTHGSGCLVHSRGSEAWRYPIRVDLEAGWAAAALAAQVPINRRVNTATRIYPPCGTEK